MPKNVGVLGKLIVANSLKNLHKVKKIAQSRQTGQFIFNVRYFHNSTKSLHKEKIPLSLKDLKDCSTIRKSVASLNNDRYLCKGHGADFIIKLT